MGVVRIVRHGKKGNGKVGPGLDCGPKNFLSPRGVQDAMRLGQLFANNYTGIHPLDEQAGTDFVKGLVRVGGGEMSRSTHTALLIANGAGVDPLIVASAKELGSEKQMIEGFGLTFEGYDEAVKNNGNLSLAGLKALCTEQQIQLLSNQIYTHVTKIAKLKGNSLLGTHSPWLELLVEMITRRPNHANYRELSWIEVRLVDSRLIMTDSVIHLG